MNLRIGIFAFLPFALFAAKTAVPHLPEGEMPNTEIATNLVLRIDTAKTERLVFTIEADNSPSNSLSVAVGSDANGDGDLSLEEADVVFGFDCGEWFAAKTAVLHLPEGEMPNTEIATNLVLRIDTAKTERLVFTIEAENSPSNSLSVAVGSDANGDGDLSLEEVDVVFGFDCGEWFEAQTASGAVSSEAVQGGRISRDVTFLDKTIFGGWNLAKVVKRGLGEIDKRVVTDIRRTHFSLIFR